MAVRQYIGARYVPIVMGEWDNTKEYEPLSIVTYQGASYTSRQFTPPGIAITNDEYWALTGDYDAQIIAYRQDVDAINDALPIADFNSASTVKDAIDSVASDMSDLADLLPASDYSAASTVKDAIDDLAALLPASDFDSVNTVKAAIEAVASDVNALEESAFVSVKDYGAIGDGIADDSNAFQSAIDSGYDVYVPTSHGERYKITKTLNISTPYQRIFSEPHCNIMELSISKGISFEPNTDTELFKVGTAAFNVCFFNLNMMQTSGSDRQYTAITTNIGDPSSDTYVIGCYFYNFETSVYVHGRGLHVESSSFVKTKYGIHLYYDSTYDGSGLNSQEAGNRAHRIVNNRFHGIADRAIYIEGSYLSSIIVTDNMYDNGTGCFFDCYAICYHATINNNVIGYNSTEAIRFRAEARYTTINGNNFYCAAADSTGYPTPARNFIRFYDSAQYIVICGNSFSNCLQDCIRFDSITNLITIMSNSFAYWGLTSGTVYGAIFLNDNSRRVSIIGNPAINAESTNFLVKVKSGSTFTDNKITLNPYSGNTPVQENYTLSGSRNVIDRWS